MSCRSMPRALAVSRSTSTKICGTLARNVVAERRRLGQLVEVRHHRVHLPREGRDVLPDSRLEVELETRRRAEARDLGEIEGEGDGVLHSEELPVDPGQDRVEGVLLVALVPGLEQREQGRAVGLVGLRQQVEAHETGELRDRRLLAKDPLDSLHHRVGPLPRGPVGQLDGHDEEALVLGRDEGTSAPAGRARRRVPGSRRIRPPRRRPGSVSARRHSHTRAWRGRTSR